MGVVVRLLRLLLNPAALVSFGAAGLIFLAYWLYIQFRPFDLVWLLLVILCIVFVYVVVMILLRLRAARAGSKLQSSLEDEADRETGAARPGHEQEIEQLKARMLEAIEALKRSPAGRAAGGASALYVLPWYMVIGPPAAGKTTLLKNSGLSFPYTDASGRGSSVQGVRGTRNCGWWFAEEAIILDTAGRYIDSYEAEAHEEWLGFLDLLREQRGRKPINGLVVTMSVEDLICGSEDDIDSHAGKIRTRIDELIQRLGLTFPVYVVFTKCDLIRGFWEAFHDFSREERSQVLGASLARDRVAEESSREVFAAEMKPLLKALQQAAVQRVGRGCDAQERHDAFFFPEQLVALQPRMERFVEVLFRENPYQQPPVFRGFYFSSGTQEGPALDPVMQALVESSEDPDAALPAPPEPRAIDEKRSFFIRQFFSRIAIADRHMAGPSAKEERRRRRQRVLAFSGAFTVFILFVLLLIGLTVRNRGLIDDVKTLTAQVHSDAQVWDVLETEKLWKLDKLSQKLHKMERRGTPWMRTLHLGTFRGAEILREARLVQFDAVRYAILEKPRSSLMHEIVAAPAGDYLETFGRYRAVHVLADVGNRLLDEEDTKDAAAALTKWWLEQPRMPGSQDREEFEQLIRRQLIDVADHDAERRTVFNTGQDAGAAQLDNVREHLRQGWSEASLYPQMIRAAGAVIGAGPASVSAAGSSRFTGPEVPGAYTRDGYRRIADFLEELETKRGSEALRSVFLGQEPRDLRVGLLTQYASDYASHWIDFLNSIRVQQLSSAAQIEDFLRSVSTENSAVVGLVRLVSEQTAFGTTVGAPLRQLAERFGPVHSFLAPPGIEGGQPARQGYVEWWDSVAKGFDPQNPSAIGGLGSCRTRVAELVVGEEPVHQALRSLLMVPCAALRTADIATRRDALEAAWGNVRAQFESRLGNKYPFSDSPTRDVAHEGFVGFFGDDGVFWEFYEAELSPWLSPVGERHGRPSGFSLRQEICNVLARASRIRDALVAGGELGLSFSVRPGIPLPADDGDDPIFNRGSYLTIGGKEIAWETGERRIVPVSWPGEQPEEGAALRYEATAFIVPITADQGVWGLFRFAQRAERRSPCGEGCLEIEWLVSHGSRSVRVPYTFTRLPDIEIFDRGFFDFECPERITSP